MQEQQPHMPGAETAEQPVDRDEALDLSALGEPEDLEAVQLEEFTIDGICGVY